MFVGIAFIFCFYVSGEIFNFLEIPVRRALNEAQREEVSVEGLKGNEKVLPIDKLREGEKGRYVFEKTTSLGKIAIAPGTSVLSVVAKDSKGKLGLFSDEPIYIGDTIIPKGMRLRRDISVLSLDETSTDEKLIFTTALEPFQLYLFVSLYAAIALSIPFLLLQVWGFISPALYKHERKYVTPFVLLSSIQSSVHPLQIIVP